MPSTSIPSYSSCAAFMVRFDWKPRRLDASCCKVEVMNGGAGCFLVTRFLMALTLNCVCSSRCSKSCDCASFAISIFSPSTVASFAENFLVL